MLLCIIVYFLLNVTEYVYKFFIEKNLDLIVARNRCSYYHIWVHLALNRILNEYIWNQVPLCLRVLHILGCFLHFLTTSYKYNPGWSQTLLPQLPGCWDYWHVPTHIAWECLFWVPWISHIGSQGFSQNCTCKIVTHVTIKFWLSF